jgi:hypothetical protein
MRHHFSAGCKLPTARSRPPTQWPVNQLGISGSKGVGGTGYWLLITGYSFMETGILIVAVVP